MILLLNLYLYSRTTNKKDVDNHEETSIQKLVQVVKSVGIVAIENL
jgi:hypothetical protein